MENASKALIIAGSILISILIISLAVVVFRNLAGSVEENADLTQQQKEAFNSKISPYVGENISGSQVNALIQLARTINQKAITNNDMVQRVTISGVGECKIDNNGKVTYKNVPTGVFYKVSGNYSTNGLLTSITISAQ